MSHQYTLNLVWTGNAGSGTSGYQSYERSHTISVSDKPDLLLSSDSAFRGNPNRYNPEELLLASLSSCHMLWFLHLCSDTGIIVVEYSDDPVGEMKMNRDGSGQFSQVTLRPTVVISNSERLNELDALHEKAHGMCFIARSVNFDVRCEAKGM